MQFLLDIVILVVILEVLLREDVPELPKVCLICFGVAVANLVCTWLCYERIDALTLVPVLVIDGLILRFTVPLKWKQTAMVLGAFFLLKVLVVGAGKVLSGSIDLFLS